MNKYMYTQQILNLQQRNQKKQTRKLKFFQEYPGNSHLDKRYGKNNIKRTEVRTTLIYLLKEFMKYCNENNIKPILMHGGLIGYNFNDKLLPWDDDIDMIIVDEESKTNLQNYQGSDYIIEISPYANNYSVNDIHNKIVGRVISKKNGVFIDLTYFKENKDYLQCKDKHKYLINDILPIKVGVFEDVLVYLPSNIEKVLVQEYGKKVLRNNYKKWIFKNNEWCLKTRRKVNIY